MDYVTRQFINLTKQFRKELRKYQESLHHDLVQLSDRFKNSVDATKAQGKAHDKSSDTPPITIAELRTQEPIRVQTKTKKTKPEWAWALIKGTLEIGVAIAVMEYTFVTRDILNQQTDATNFAGRQTELSRKALNETRKDFILDVFDHSGSLHNGVADAQKVPFYFALVGREHEPRGWVLHAPRRQLESQAALQRNNPILPRLSLEGVAPELDCRFGTQTQLRPLKLRHLPLSCSGL